MMQKQGLLKEMYFYTFKISVFQDNIFIMKSSCSIHRTAWELEYHLPFVILYFPINSFILFPPQKNYSEGKKPRIVTQCLLNDKMRNCPCGSIHIPFVPQAVNT